ncbi:hypothetical protein DAI22_05g028000 [Oryza sativa Japonica Group]|nr:hypothetical protein DAI22_05g028000 [Oryza sativa Japonica Group]
MNPTSSEQEEPRGHGRRCLSRDPSNSKCAKVSNSYVLLHIVQTTEVLIYRNEEEVGIKVLCPHKVGCNVYTGCI